MILIDLNTDKKIKKNEKIFLKVVLFVGVSVVISYYLNFEILFINFFPL